MKEFNPTPIGRAVKMLRKSMIKQGTYSEELENSLFLVAGDLVAYERAVHDMDSLKSTTYETRSREGNIEFKPYPVFKLLPSLSKNLHKSLTSLGLTLSTLEMVDNDPLFAMLNSLEKED